MTATCKTCRWCEERIGLRKCRPYCTSLRCDAFLSGRSRFGFEYNPDRPAIKTIYEHPYVSLDFGCIHHEPNPVQVDLANSTHKWFPPVEYDEPNETDADDN